MKSVLARLAAGETLTRSEAQDAFGHIMDGGATPAQIASLVTAMHLRGETADELHGAVLAMRARMLAIAAPAGAIDVCGTGGDGAATLNVSTAVAFVVAACGVAVAKHGNRALTSRTGGADVLRELGVDIDAPVERLGGILAEVGLVFLLAPHHHAALRHAAGPRAELGFRTIFNLLGPMANPAGVRRQLVGVYDPRWAPIMADTFGALGSDFVWVVHGGGLDELSLSGETVVSEWRDGARRDFVVDPEMAGVSRSPIEAVRGGDPAQNAAALLALLKGETGPYRDMVVLNAAAALVVAGRAEDLRQGATTAVGALDSGAALAKLESLRRAVALMSGGLEALPPAGSRGRALGLA